MFLPFSEGFSLDFFLVLFCGFPQGLAPSELFDSSPEEISRMSPSQAFDVNLYRAVCLDIDAYMVASVFFSFLEAGGLFPSFDRAEMSFSRGHSLLPPLPGRA